jgi:hypothetical protein
MSQISHLITYHRYLCVPVTRSFPNGLSRVLTQAVLSGWASHFAPCERRTRATECDHDAQANSSHEGADGRVSRMIILNLLQGFYIGTWRLSGLTVQISDLVDPSNPNARYSFRMTLTLRSRPLGRWNKLEFNEYESINLEDGEATALGLKNERPFWFSKVRSYSSRIE